MLTRTSLIAAWPICWVFSDTMILPANCNGAPKEQAMCTHTQRLRAILYAGAKHDCWGWGSGVCATQTLPSQEMPSPSKSSTAKLVFGGSFFFPVTGTDSTQQQRAWQSGSRGITHITAIEIRSDWAGVPHCPA